jgi:hypothetical protein
VGGFVGYGRHNPARQAKDIASMHRPLIPEISDLTIALYKGQRSDSGESDRIVTVLCAFIS